MALGREVSKDEIKPAGILIYAIMGWALDPYQVHGWLGIQLLMILL